jgi:hypothetical protein
MTGRKHNQFAMQKNICFKLPAILIPVCILLLMLSAFRVPAGERPPGDTVSHGPRIVNIVNFIRLLEPRDPAITEDVLYQTVVEQVALMKKYHLRGTFLLQYDALMDPRYQKLLKSLPRNSFEIGAWWEIPQPLVEHAGLKWRGRYPWDWRANIGFATGYTPHERELLADVYMHDFKKIFGYYPQSVASWFIDAHTLAYLYQKYHIVASANCKDQYGTDGYTLWGGYWNQAYYPSKVNAYMPAQTAAGQIPVPVFRMLGSDPIRQYDDGTGHRRQGVITLEPVYPKGGGDEGWVNWFFDQMVNGESLGFAYTQAGQENSFTWAAMKKGLEMQFPLIKKLSDEGKVKVETLAESGKWFKARYKLTPATAVTVTSDLPGGTDRTVWFDSRFYRANLLWENGTLRFRDIHLFDERLASKYLKEVATSNECSFFTLPVMDAFLWSAKDKIAGLKFKVMLNGKEELMQGGDPVVSSTQPGTLNISWPLTNIKGQLEMVFTAKQARIYLRSSEPVQWQVAMDAADGAELPFKGITPGKVSAQFEGMDYSITAQKGTFADPGHHGQFTITPYQNTILLDL